MLSLIIPPSYPEISAKPLELPRDLDDLVSIHELDHYDPLFTERPSATELEEHYHPLIKIPDYNAYLVSYPDTILFLLELTPRNSTLVDDLDMEDADVYFINILGPNVKAHIADATYALKACLAAFSAQRKIDRLIFPVFFNSPGSPLRLLLAKAGFTVLKENADLESPVIYALSE